MLQDSFGRKIEYIRLSVTDRCDFRCAYCLPKGFKGFTQPDSWLKLDEIERLVGIFAELGVSKVRLTGGEPHQAAAGYRRPFAQYQRFTTGETSSGPAGQRCESHQRQSRQPGRPALS